MRVVCFLLFTVLSHKVVWAQLNDTDIKHFALLEDSLCRIKNRVFYSKLEKNRFEANKQFLALWNEVLKDEKSLHYPFDSLKKDISILMAPDQKFRLITWDMRKDDQTYGYFGFIQINNTRTTKKGLFKKEKNVQYELFQLLDKSGTVKTPENYVADPSKWFGMLYYDIVKSDDDYYTLLGWDGNDKLVQRKFIDILWFKPDGSPVFGKDVFKIPGKFTKRMMFEYAGEVTMSLKYNSNRKQIVFSHLAPNTLDPTLENQPQYYGPDGSFDALSSKKGKWVYEADIDIRKDKDKNDNLKRPDPNKQTPIYKPK